MRSELFGLLHPRYWLTWIGVGLTSLLCLLPWRLRDWIAAGIARIAYRANSKQINIARVNLRLCYPSWSAPQTEQFLLVYFIRYVQILMQLPFIWWHSSDSLRRRLEVHGLENLAFHHKAGKPVVLLFNHCMAIDFGAVCLSSLFPLRGIYKPFPNKVIEWLFKRGRIRFGARVTARGNEMRVILKALKEGGMLVYLSDEDFGAQGSVFAPFFGNPKATLAMLPRLVRHSGSAVVPVYTHYDTGTGKFIVTVTPALDNYPVEDEIKNASTHNLAYEKLVGLCPEQYLWKLRYFRTREDGGPSIYRDC